MPSPFTAYRNRYRGSFGLASLTNVTWSLPGDTTYRITWPSLSK
ncbi:MAG TPA: hypothetical protein VH583_14470 [Vicinamibacterales bacterium]